VEMPVRMIRTDFGILSPDRNKAVLQSYIKRAVKKFLPRRNKEAGVEYYAQEKGLNPGLQTYYVQNIEAIHQGIVPDRYERIAALTPGRRVVEFGAADGTQSLVLALQKERVCGVELMDLQFREAEQLKSDWLALGRNVENCSFVQRDIRDSADLLKDTDTVLMSRVLYHLRENAGAAMADIQASDVRHVVLVGCPRRTERWQKLGETGDAMGKYAYFATPEGMASVLRDYGFRVIKSLGCEGGNDPVVVGER